MSEGQTMRIAYTTSPERGDTDELLLNLAADLENRGIRARGVVQTNIDCPSGGPCDMDVRVLPDGPVIRISQSLGAEARGCRLDPAALETAVGLVDASLDAETDLLIINKFGKHEADGRGFREVIGKAMMQGTPVLVGLNNLNAKAFEAFAGGTAVALEPNLEVLARWVTEEMEARGAAA